LEIPASSITSLLLQPKLKFSSLTLLEDIKAKNSEKHCAQSSRDLLDHFSSTAEIQEKKLKPSELLDTHLRSLTFSQEETHWKYWWAPLCWLDQEKIPLELVLEVLSESKQLTSLPSEESTRPST
jgi:hypothetical protein